jgi:hypothetical protein
MASDAPHTPVTSPELHPEDPEEAKLIAVSQELARIDRESGWNRTFAIGKLILETFFGGEPACWHSRRWEGRQSVRRLAARPECPLKKSALAEAVSVYLIALENPVLTRSPTITPSHVACVLKLEEAGRRKLLREAEEKEMHVRDLRKRVELIRAISTPTANRAENKTTRKKLQDGLYAALTALREVRLLLPATSDSLPDDLVYSLWSLVEALEAELSETRNALRSPFREGARAA